MNVAHSILVVDDDPHIRDVVRFAFEKTGMLISTAQDGKEALRQFDRNVHELVVLDIGMPEMDGLEVCRQIRKTADTPILFLSARDEEIDRILGLEIGGDDYVTKPFSPRELVARVNAILRRTRNGAAPAPAAAKAMRHGELAVDSDARTAAFQDTPVSLTNGEYALLLAFLEAPQRPLTREMLLQATRVPEDIFDRSIDVQVLRLRRKLGIDPNAPRVIETERGVGYIFTAIVEPF